MIKFFGYYRDGAVVQRGERTTVRGVAAAGAEIACSLSGGEYREEKLCRADGKGRFRTEFSPVGDTESEFVLKAVSGGEETAVKLRFGDVYLAMGQSNMSYALSATENWEDWRRRAGDAQTAFLSLAEKPFKDISEVTRPAYPLNDFISDYSWTAGGDESVADVSALCVQSAVILSERRGVPVGMVQTAMGGLGVEAYLRRETLEADVELVRFLRRMGRYQSLREYNKAGGRNFSQPAGVWNGKKSLRYSA